MDIIDFHCHHVPLGIDVTAAQTALPSQRERWERTARLVSDEELLVQNIDAGDISARVVSTPPSQICAQSGDFPVDLSRRLNDALAALVARQPGRIFALATVNAFDGESAAREAERAVRSLGLSGIFVDSARDGLLIGAPQARPVFEVAQELDVPVFVHPVNRQPLFSQMEPYGRVGTLFARGTVNGQALISLLEGGAFLKLETVKVVFTALAFGGLALAAGYSHHSRLGRDVRDVLRRNVYIDTMGFDSALIRASVEILGPEHVVTGSDWPIVRDGPIADVLAQALDGADLSAKVRTAIAATNARRLFKNSG